MRRHHLLAALAILLGTRGCTVGYVVGVGTPDVHVERNARCERRCVVSTAPRGGDCDYDSGGEGRYAAGERCAKQWVREVRECTMECVDGPGPTSDSGAGCRP